MCYLLFTLHDSISSVQLFQQLVDVIDPQGVPAVFTYLGNVTISYDIPAPLPDTEGGKLEMLVSVIEFVCTYNL